MNRLALLMAVVWVSSLCAEDAYEALWGRAEWESLDTYQESLTRDEFKRAMEERYAPRADWASWMRLEDDGVWVRMSAEDPDSEYFLKFRAGEPLESEPSRSGLRGFRIVLDPGHIGGRWAEMEERSFSLGDQPVVREGDLTLAAALRLEKLLQGAGSQVWLTRRDTEPVTRLRPEDFLEEAELRLVEGGDLAGEALEAERRELAERLFYRTAEIRARARVVNLLFKPDLTLSLHVNAVAWPDPQNPALVARNEGHVIVGGCFLADELASETQRFELLRRLVRRHGILETRVARSLVTSMVEATGLDPYIYRGDNALQLDEDGYLWARNLLVNRTFDSPVIYLEPWIANSEAVYAWAAAGDYEGEREFGGELRRSLPAVYAEFVFEGLRRGLAE